MVLPAWLGSFGSSVVPMLSPTAAATGPIPAGRGSLECCQDFPAESPELESSKMSLFATSPSPGLEWEEASLPCGCQDSNVPDSPGCHQLVFTG